MTTLYRKHRPQNFADILGQPAVTTTLAKAVAANTVAHAYLFSGPRGTGKTSVARILAKALNCQQRTTSLEKLPCNTCENCRAIDAGSFLDVIELDAASNRGIDEIRSLKEQVAVSPLQGAHKVYILDEVHMLTTEAFNALLKTLEEPPKHVVFILCTTESHKVPLTIASRCQRFAFARASVADLEAQLKKIAINEKIAIDDQAIALLAQQADGGYRDAAMLLEQIATQSNTKKSAAITIQDIEQRLGLASQELRHRLITSFLNHQPDQAILDLETFAKAGGNIQALTTDLTHHFRLILLAATSPDALKNLADSTTLSQVKDWAGQTSISQLIGFIKALLAIQAQRGSQPALALELAFLEHAAESVPAPIVSTEPAEPTAQPATAATPAKIVSNPTPSAKPNSPDQPVPARTPKPSAEQLQTSQAGNDLLPSSRQATRPDPVGAKPSNTAKLESDLVSNTASSPQAPSHSSPSTAVPANDAIALHQSWQQILAAIRPRSRSVEALLRDCTPLSFDGTIILLQFWYAFHKKQLETDKNHRLVEEVASQVFGTPVKVKCQLGDKSQRPKKRPMTETDVHNVAAVVEEGSLAQAAAEIFGGEFIN